MVSHLVSFVCVLRPTQAKIVIPIGNNIVATDTGNLLITPFITVFNHVMTMSGFKP